jgi:hypothetical protein
MLFPGTNHRDRLLDTVCLKKSGLLRVCSVAALVEFNRKD